jgi:hypothetical protein
MGIDSLKFNPFSGMASGIQQKGPQFGAPPVGRELGDMGTLNRPVTGGPGCRTGNYLNISA